jgi:hypothetical protein
MINRKGRYRYPDARIMIFAKAPVPGKVKTRLSGMLGKRGAASLHSSLVQTLLAKLSVSALSPIELWCAPDCKHPFFSSCKRDSSVRLKSQAAGDIGQRMHQAFISTLKVAPYALLVGSDAPELTYDRLEQSLSALRKGKDAVFVPALDGGYVLVGLRSPVRNLFTNISWGSADVMKETRRRLQRNQLDWLELPACGDIDIPEDLKRFKRSNPL